MKRKKIEPSASPSDNDTSPHSDLQCSIQAALQLAQQLNPTREDLLYILRKITSKTTAMRWSSFPKDLWPSVFSQLTSNEDFSSAHLVCKYWNSILLDEHFWENYVSYIWNLDATIKSQYTFPASKYSKLRIFLENTCSGMRGFYHYFRCVGGADRERLRITCLILLSSTQVGFVCANWVYWDMVEEERVSNIQGNCRVICNKYNAEWFGTQGDDFDLFVSDSVIEECDGGWKEKENFGEIRRMLGYGGWKELIHKVVDLCVEGGDSSLWTSDDKYRWNGFIEHYLPLVDVQGDSQKELDYYALMNRKMDKITGLSLHSRRR